LPVPRSPRRATTMPPVTVLASAAPTCSVACGSGRCQRPVI